MIQRLISYLLVIIILVGPVVWLVVYTIGRDPK